MPPTTIIPTMISNRGDAPFGHRPTRTAVLEDAQLFKAPEALAVWVAMASIKAGDKAS